MISDPASLPFLPQGIKIIEYLGKGKSGYSYQASINDKNIVLKLMHDEPCSYYQFSQNKVETEIHAYRLLKHIGIAIPDLILSDAKNNYLIKEYVDGPTAASWLIKGGNPEIVLSQLFGMAEKAKRNDINIDYFPTNFVIHHDRLFYIDYEINSYADEWNLENWGLYYWANPEGLATYFKTGNPLAINVSEGDGKPITNPFVIRVEEWIKKYSDLTDDR